MPRRLDEIDKRVLYRLAENARDTSAPTIAAEVNVSPGTIRNRIKQLESEGVITGYHAAIDYERADGGVRELFVCNAPVPDRERLARQVLGVPGVVNVRELMAGRGSLHVSAVGSDGGDLARIARVIAELGVSIEEEYLIRSDRSRSYEPYGPEEGFAEPSVTDFMSLAGGAEVVDLAVTPEAPIAGTSLKEANDRGLLGEDVLVVALERNGEVLTPRGDTVIRPDDLATVFSRDGVSDELLVQFNDDRRRGRESTGTTGEESDESGRT